MTIPELIIKYKASLKEAKKRYEEHPNDSDKKIIIVLKTIISDLEESKKQYY